MKKNSLKYAWVLIAWMIFHAQAHAIENPRPHFKVVIDPGHGGSDEGTVYSNSKVRVTEKDTTLALAREVARELRAKKISVILTRNRDQEVPLGDRTALANRIGADLFLSIHLNSTPASQNSNAQSKNEAEGIETFILNNTTDESSRRLARLENTVLGPTHEDLDIALILRDLKLDANLAESKRLACTVQKHLMTQVSKSHHFIKNRGVKQALFHVLLGAEMPSVLIEAGFMSHPQDRSFLISTQGRKAVGRAIAHAIDQFRRNKGNPQAHSILSRCKIN